MMVDVCKIGNILIMKNLLLILMFIVSIVQAQEVTFANNAGKRQQIVKTLREKAVMEKTFAVEWAKKNGVPVMTDNGFQKMELMRFENNKPL